MPLQLIQGRGWPASHPVFGPRKVPPMTDPYLLGCLPVDPDWMLRPAEAATLAGVTTPTLRNWDRAGKLGDGVELTESGERRYRAGAIIAHLERLGKVRADRAADELAWAEQAARRDREAGQ